MHHELIQCQAALRSLARRLSRAEDRVRRKIAEGLHDDLGQLLVSVQLHLHELRGAGTEDSREHTLNTIDALVADTVATTRRLTFETMVPNLPEIRLESELGRLAGRLEERHGIPCEFTYTAAGVRVSRDTAMAVLRSVRELLTNTVAHSQATAAEVAVAGGERLRIAVVDDGVGMSLPPPPPSPAGGFGLLIAAERITEVGGDLEITSAPGGGTRVSISVPLADRLAS